MAIKIQLPGRSLKRLFGYYREVCRLHSEGETLVSSAHLARVLSIKSTQVRKDLNYLGGFGKRGVGYPIEVLRQELKHILKLERRWNVALAGMGNLGRALVGYGAFRENGYFIRAAFERSPALIGTTVEGVRIYSIEELKKIVHQKRISLMMVAVPRENAQEVVNRAAAAGIEGILNFSPLSVKAPKNVWVRTVDLSEQLNVLAFRLEHGARDDE